MKKSIQKPSDFLYVYFSPVAGICCTNESRRIVENFCDEFAREEDPLIKKYVLSEDDE